MQALCSALVTGVSCTRLIADINLIAQVLMIVALWIGVYFARSKQIPRHRNVQTTVVVANIFFIAFVMLTSFYSYVIVGGTTGGIVAMLMMVHGLLGLTAELMGIYLVLRMRTQLIPARFRVRNFKRLMHITLGLWSIIVVLGLGIYFYRYLQPPTTAAVVPEPEPTPTAAARPPTATSAPAATSTPTAIPARGVLTFANDKGLNDQAIVRLSNVPPPPAGRIYQAWFASSNVALLASAGEVKVNPDRTATVEYHEPNASNLIMLYDQFFVSVEPALAARPSATMVFSGQFAARLSGEVKLLLGSAPDTPGRVGYVVGLHDHIDHLLIHADEIRKAATRANLATTRRHAEHLVNLLQGSKGANYGDTDGDGRVEDPGDGFGIVNYTSQAAQHALLASGSPDASPELRQRAAEIQVVAANMNKQADAVLKQALSILAARDIQSLSAFARDADLAARALVRGVDRNGNGRIELIADEGGFQQLFFATQEFAGLALTPIAIVVAQNLPTPTPTPPPTPTPTPQPRSVTILMQDFAFKEKNLTIDRGTALVWINKDPAKHTVTSDSGATLDSKDIGVDGRFAFTFDTPGTFPYFCLYHGDRGGVDMAGRITVR